MILGLDLFSGYGGISYALKDYVQTIGYCEIEEYPKAILRSRMHEGLLTTAPIYPDVRRLKGTRGACDIVTGGFPCQDISVAGARKGLDGERSGLFFEIVRLTKEITPTFVFLENVPGIRTNGLRQVVGAFTEMGYDCRWTCITARSLGAPHKRERWFLLAYTKCKTIRLKWKWNPKGKTKTEIEHRNNDKTRATTDTKRERLERCRDYRSACTTREKTPFTASAAIHSHSLWCQDYREVLRMDDGTPFRVDRIKSLGNGVVPIQVKTAFEKLMGLRL